MLDFLLDQVSSQEQLQYLLSVKQPLNDAEFAQTLLLAVNADAEDVVRLEALKILSVYSQPLQYVFLKNGLYHLILNDPNEYIRVAALNALSAHSLDEHELAKLLLALLEDSNRLVQAAYFATFAQHKGDMRVREALQRLAQNPSFAENVKRCLTA